MQTVMSDCCNEFSRSSLMRKAVAQAGSGLPAIEPGMPLPAGTGLDRRSFLARSVGLALAVYGGSALAPRAFDQGIAQALAAGGPDTVLVSVFLDGGADNLSLLFPHGDPEYRRLRPKLALPDSGLVFPEDTRLRWHPSARAFHTLHNEGKLSVLPAVGYTDADQSHFTSRHYWEVGDTNARPPDRLARPLPRSRRKQRQPAAGREPRRRPLARRSRPRRSPSRH